ncbi:MAG: MEDS domain-containing protein, partial [Proteobacteria bacterium]|nr:MEDS domain-containing protein [Pseudomonadota bacterium]
MSAMKTDGVHVCQLHHNEDELTHNVARYVKEGLGLGSAVVVVAGDKRRHSLDRFLAANAFGERATRLLTVIDSRILLARFMRGDKPDRGRFRDALCPLLDKAIASGKGLPRVYGEMVNDLWHGGNPAGAILLERYWNELLQEYEFSL